MTAPITRWHAMLNDLLGLPLPALPPIPGRLFVAPPPPLADAFAEAWDALHPHAQPMPLPSVTELAALCAITRQAASVRLARAERTGDVSGLLAPKLYGRAERLTIDSRSTKG